MWLLVGGRGRGDRYFRGGKKNSLGAARNWRASVVQAGAVDYRRRSFLRKPDKTMRRDILYRIHMILASKLFVVYLIFHYVLKYIMVLRRERTVFELLEHFICSEHATIGVSSKKLNYSWFVWAFS